MAGQSDLLARIVALVRPFDDAAWEALANKGLLRRARKDLESGALPVCVEGEEKGSVRLTVGPCTVLVPEAGPAKATCTCPAAGTCQHILAAGLFLQRLETGEPPANDDVPAPTDSADPWLALDLETIRRWAGAAEFRAAVALALAESDALTLDTNAAGLLVVRFPGPGAECRLSPGVGLDGIIVSGGNAKHTRRLTVAAVLALRRARGLELPADVIAAIAAEGENGALQAAADAPRSRAEVLASVRALLQESVAVGLVHLGVSTGDRLITLSISALGVNLPRLALALKNLADEVRLLTARAARADTGRFLWSMARTHALAEALAGPAGQRADLVGAHRSQYDEIDALELTGVCAYPWRTASGYQGLTVLFWDARRQEWASWTDARPEGQPGGFDPRARYGAEVAWEGGLTPYQLSRSRVRLRRARRNRAGRLSSSARCAVTVLGPTAGGEVAFGARLFTSWETLRVYAADSLSVGLRETVGAREVVVVQPAGWRDRKFDPVEQVFRWWVEDDTGETLALQLPFDAWTRQAIGTLENLALPAAGSPPWQVVARVVRQGRELSLYPLTLLRYQAPAAATGTLHLHLDAVGSPSPVAAVRSRATTANEETPEPELTEESDSDDNVDSPLLDGTALDRALGSLETRLDALAEAGTASFAGRADGEWLAQQGDRLEALGLGALSRGSRRIAPGGDAKAVAAALLSCRYLCGVHRQVAGKVAVSPPKPE